MADRYFTHIVGCLEASIKAAEDGVDCHVPVVTVQGAVDLLKEQQERIERLQPKKGHWEMKPDPFGFFDEIPSCSECGCTNTMRKKTEFCEHCGADMREGDEE